MRKLYLVDYEESGCNMHQAFEGIGTNLPTDKETIQMFHCCIGNENRLSSIAEFTTDLSLDEFKKICDMPEVLMLPHRILYVDMEEIKKVREMMNK